MGLPVPGGPQDFLKPILIEQPIWRGLYESLHERFFPAHLPPLELTSTPIPVPDRMASNTNPWAVGTATLVNGGILALLVMMGVRAVVQSNPVAPRKSAFHIDNFP